jgi:hypothetical protein
MGNIDSNTSNVITDATVQTDVEVNKKIYKILFSFFSIFPDMFSLDVFVFYIDASCIIYIRIFNAINQNTKINCIYEKAKTKQKIMLLNK